MILSCTGMLYDPVVTALWLWSADQPVLYFKVAIESMQQPRGNQRPSDLPSSSLPVTPCPCCDSAPALYLHPTAFALLCVRCHRFCLFVCLFVFSPSSRSFSLSLSLSQVQHVHLALTSEANSMRVSWVTGHSSQAPAVRFRGIAPGAEEGMSGTQVASWQVRRS